MFLPSLHSMWFAVGTNDYGKTTESGGKMAYSENRMEHARLVDGIFTYYVEITCDTAAEMPDPAEHPNWEIGSQLLVLEDGGSVYRLSNTREWVAVNFPEAGKGGDKGSLSTKLYVNAASGSDSNNGLTSSTAFQTLAKAMEIAQTYGMAEIQLAAGEYQFADFVQHVYHGDVRITGAGQDSTTLYAQVYANHANVEIGSLTLDTTHGTSLSAAALTVIHGGTGKLANVTITTASENGVYVGNMGYVFLYSVVINGSTQRMVYLTNDGQATLQSVSGTTESDRPNVMAGAASLVRIVTSPNLTYSTNYSGIVYVDGVQRSPVDLSAVTASTLQTTVLDREETLETF